jgi:diacylglycerol O-acyltransferase / wax synthase
MDTSTRAMSAQDSLWLTMDRPNNLMVIDGVMLCSAPPSWDELVAATTERLVERFPVFRCRALHGEQGWVWQPDPLFDLGRHLRRVTLPGPSGIAELEDYMSQQRARPLDRDRPLWELTLVDDVVLDDGRVGAALVARFHHAIADGVRLTQVMLSLCDTTDPRVAAMVARERGEVTPRTVMRGVADATTEAVADGTRALLRAVTSISHDTRAALASTLQVGSQVVRSPGHLVDAFDAWGIDNRVANTTASVAKLALRGHSVTTVWSGKPGTRKAVAWSPLLSLDDVKAVGRRHGASVNDVLLTAVSGGLRNYLRAHGDGTATEVEWMVPVNLVPIDENLPEDLGNFFALVMAVLPLEPADPVERLELTMARMSRIKRSDEPILTFGIQRGISAAPTPVSTALTDFFANKAVGVLTNVPGPRSPLTFAGAPVHQVIGFAPSSGDQPMTCTIFSYAGSVTIGFATDADLVPDPRKLVEGTVAELAALVGMST